MKQDSDDGIRPALPDEAPLLSDLALRSKGHWGYGVEFLEACRAELTISPQDIAARPVFVLEKESRILGFYTLSALDYEAELAHLFIEPQAIGRGYGRLLWLHAVKTAEHLACKAITIQSDPFAEKFYQAMGARRVGEAASTVRPDRRLPVLRFSLREPHR